MKFKHSLLSLLFVAFTSVLLINCSGSGKSKVMSVDELMVNAETMIGDDVIVEGFCTHVCSKSGMKLFLKGEESDQTIRAESGSTLGKFDPESVDKYVRVRGKIVLDKQEADVHEHEGEECEAEASQILYHIAAEHYQIIAAK